MIGHMLANVLLYIEGKFTSLLSMYYVYHYAKQITNMNVQLFFNKIISILTGDAIKNNIGDDVPYLSLNDDDCWKVINN